MSTRFLSHREALAAGERAVLTGLLEDVHRCMDRLPALPAARPGAPAAAASQQLAPYIPPQLLPVVRQGAEAVATAAHRVERLQTGRPAGGVEAPAFFERRRQLQGGCPREAPDLDCTSGAEPFWWVPGEGEDCGGDEAGRLKELQALQEQEHARAVQAEQERLQSIAARVLIGKRAAVASGQPPQQQQGGPELQTQLPRGGNGAAQCSTAATIGRVGPIQIGRRR